MSKNYKGIKYNSHTLLPEIIDINFEVKDDNNGERWVRIIKGNSTGYEGLPIKKALNEYLDKGVFINWVACSGTLNKYPRLEIPMIELINYLIDNNYIFLEKEYDYIKKINWLK